MLFGERKYMSSSDSNNDNINNNMVLLAKPSAFAI